MICEHCGSSNIRPQIIVEDKQSRNNICALFGVLIPMLVCIVVGIILDAAILFIIIGLFLGGIIGRIAKVVSMLIPAREYTVFICCDCGETTEM